MDWRLFWQLAITVMIAVLGTWAAHRFTSRRDVENERRKLRVQYLLEVYRLLERADSTPDGPERWERYERAAADIQLLGSPEQVRLAREWIREFTANKNKASIDRMMNSLRVSLRRELNLEPVDGQVVYLRIRRNVAATEN